MAFDVTVDCTKDQARWALMQFALRRGMRIVEPWYLEGVRIEGPPAPARGAWESHRDGWWERAGAFLFNWPTDRPAVDIEISRRKGRTVVSLSPGSREDCLMLAHRIEAFLRDGSTKTATAPAVCPTCQAPVEVVTASFCGRCGKRLIATEIEKPPRRSDVAPAVRAAELEPAQPQGQADSVAAAASEASAAVEATPVSEARDAGEASAAGEVAIERAAEPAEAAEASAAGGEDGVPQQEEMNREPVRPRRRERDAEAETVVED